MSARSTRRCWKTLIALFLCLLSACSTGPEARPPVDPAPANLRAMCPPAAQLPNRPLLVGELAEADAELAGLYRECRLRHQGLVDWAEGMSRRKASTGVVGN